MYTFSNVHEKGFSKRHEAVVCLCVWVGVEAQGHLSIAWTPTEKVGLQVNSMILSIFTCGGNM